MQDSMTSSTSSTSTDSDSDTTTSDEKSGVDSDSATSSVKRAALIKWHCIRFDDTVDDGEQGRRKQRAAIQIREVLEDDAFGLFIWPSARLLAWYVWRHRDAIRHKRVLEIGAGVGLPGLLAATIGADKVWLTDAADNTRVLENLHVEVQANTLNPTSVVVRGLSWGSMGSAAQQCCPVDLILGADVLYEPAAFDDVFATVAFILSESPPAAEFITVYQVRSSSRSIAPACAKYALTAEIIPVADVVADGAEFDSLRVIRCRLM